MSSQKPHPAFRHISRPSGCSADAHKYENLLSAGQVAEILGFHPDTVKRLARKGDIPSLKFNSRVLRFHRTAVEAFIKAAEIPGRQ